MKADTKTPKVEEEKNVKNAEPDLMDLLKGISEGLGDIASRMDKMETEVGDMKNGGVNKFMREAKQEDIEAASEGRVGIDPKLSKIVDEMLGADFGIELQPLGDRPGFRLSILVPPRLSDNVRDRKPVLETDENGNPTGQYKKDAMGATVFESYIPEDRRSRIISSSDSYDAVKQHCERVRGYIISFFQKTNQPLPEFKLK